MKRTLAIVCFASLVSSHADAAEIPWAEVPELAYPEWPSAAPTTTRAVDDVTMVGKRMESDRCLSVREGSRRDHVRSLEVPRETTIVRSEQLLRRDAAAFLVVEYLFLEHGRVRGGRAIELPLQPIITAAGVEVFGFRDRTTVHVVVPVEAQMVFREPLGAGECVCTHLHIALPIADEPSFGSAALASGAIGLDDPSASPRVLTIAASVSRVARDRAPRLSLTTSVRSMLGRGR